MTPYYLPIKLDTPTKLRYPVVMTPISLHILVPTLQAVPAVFVFSTQLLLTEKSSVAVEPGSSDAKTVNFTHSVAKTTMILEEFPGYNHSGLNE
ncbi:MAG: hypothetical protein ACLQAH_15600 [Limisphaerales bacterium]